MSLNNSIPVVITRPLAQARVMAPRVEALGRKAVVFPLLCIAPAENPDQLRDRFRDLSVYEMVIFVSPNAVDAAFQFISGWPYGVKIGIVGEGSRLALRQYGVTDDNTTIIGPRDTEKMDSEELLKSLHIESLCGKRVLIVRGQAGRDFLSHILRSLNIEVEHLTAYHRLAPQLDAAQTVQFLQLLDDENEWLITSSEALRNLLDLASRLGGGERVVKLQRKKFIVSHHRIAETARSLGFQSVILTGSGDERLLAALQSST
jgi:uroporphyrinogen-III synthase